MLPHAKRYASAEEIENRVAKLSRPALIAIDGLPVSGKSTLADRLCQRFELDCITLDDFVRPERDWPSHDRPAFPFEYIRYDAFLAAIRSLATTRECRFRPFDWQTLDIASEERTVGTERPVIVEGVSALNPDVAELHDLRIFVDSDRATMIEATLARGAGNWGKEWRQLFAPSADIYMTTRPMERADLIFAGRGVYSPR